MSQQLTFSASVSALTFALFALMVVLGGVGDGSAQLDPAPATPLVWQALAD